VQVEVRPWGQHEVSPALESGEADVMLGYYGALPAGHREQPLFQEEYVCIVRKRHPLVRGRLTLKRYLELRHVLVTQRPGGLGSVDVALARMGLSRSVGARVSHFLMVPELVARTDMVAAVGRRVALSSAHNLGLAVFTPPLSLPKSTVGQVWHERTDADPGNSWLRRVLSEVCSQV
jgi:DNA-binding transcriptional LysR family regulator